MGKVVIATAMLAAVGVLGYALPPVDDGAHTATVTKAMVSGLHLAKPNGESVSPYSPGPVLRTQVQLPAPRPSQAGDANARGKAQNAPIRLMQHRIMTPSQSAQAKPLPSAPVYSGVVPGDSAARTALVRRLQRELKRTGCYSGSINGRWSEGTKDAMRAFVRSVNARLPYREPDFVLLALVRSHERVICKSDLEVAGVPRAVPRIYRHPDAEGPARAQPRRNGKFVKAARSAKAAAGKIIPASEVALPARRPSGQTQVVDVRPASLARPSVAAPRVTGSLARPEPPKSKRAVASPRLASTQRSVPAFTAPKVPAERSRARPPRERAKPTAAQPYRETPSQAVRRRLSVARATLLRARARSRQRAAARARAAVVLRRRRADARSRRARRAHLNRLRAKRRANARSKRRVHVARSRRRRKFTSMRFFQKLHGW